MINNNFKYKISDYLKDDSEEKKEIDLMKVVKEGKPNVSVDRTLLLQRTEELSSSYNSQSKKIDLMKEIVAEIETELISGKTEDEYRKIYSALSKVEIMLNKSKNSLEEKEIEMIQEKLNREKKKCVSLIFDAKCQEWEDKHSFRK